MKRKHHDAIVAWAGWAEIQYRKDAGMMWTDSPDPAWVEDYEYRVKPAREYPTTRMTREEMLEVVRSASGGFSDSYASLLNAGLRHAIDNGQVVTREEFDRAIGDRNKRDMAVADAITQHWYLSGRDAPNLPTLLNIMSRSSLHSIVSKVSK